MESFDDCRAVNDPGRSEHGNPDMVFLKKTNHSMILGYAEAKDVNVSLDKTEKTNQMQRYGGYANLFLTDYLEFRFYKNGEKYKTLRLGSIKDGILIPDRTIAPQLADELAEFLRLPPERIRSGRRLAEIMGAKARRIRDNVTLYLAHADSKSNTELEKIYAMLRQLLVHDLTAEKFADMYAQTLVYGLFVARFGDTTPEDFTRQEARDLVPKSNPFLRKFFDHIAGSDFDARLSYIVDELCEVFMVSDVKDIVNKHLKVIAAEHGNKDPIIHFYEDFLKEYDPAERKKMGAYYTPVPVVRFIVRQVDEILKRDFNIPKGLADTEKRTIGTLKAGTKNTLHRVQVLDPAVGTATFLNETIKFIHESFRGQEGRWPAYVKTDLLPRLYGFELMMAPYTIAHLKLGMTLQETGVTDLTDRLGVFLTNTLEEGSPNQSDLFSHFGLADVVAEESRKASVIKHERPIMIVMGNPPYSGVSSNNTPYANKLVDKYKFEPGGKQKLQERKHWLNDDYVKFIAFTEDLIEKNGEGVVAMITNHGYLDNPTFRGMRWHLAKTFDQIYVLDLHGNTIKKEISPDGHKDENVFDIMQGVAILIAVKTNTKRKGQLAEVSHAKLFGLRKDKFIALTQDINWSKLTLNAKTLTFAPQNDVGRAKYDEGVDVNSLFISGTSGVQTSRDNFVVDFDKNILKRRLEDFLDLQISDADIRAKYFKPGSTKYLPGDTRGWEIHGVRRSFKQSEKEYIIKYSYRPLDNREIAYDTRLIDWPRYEVLRNMLEPNLSITIGRQGQAVGAGIWNLAYVQDTVSDLNLFYRGGGVVFPLYIYHDDSTRTPNFKPDTLKQLTKNLTIKYSPEDILDYIYASLHSPEYREMYKEFLKADFPRVPVPNGNDRFVRLIALGRELRGLHLMTSTLAHEYATTYPITGSDEIDRISYTEGQVWINDSQYFGNVPDVAWNFYIGGYQPAQKWLKDRKGKKVSNEDIDHYQMIIKVLIETARIMMAVDSSG